MSYRHYEQSMAIMRGDRIEDKVDFYSIIMAAMRRADTENSEKLKAAFPKQWKELWERYKAPSGFISPEEAKAISEDLTDDQIDRLDFPREGWPYG